MAHTSPPACFTQSVTAARMAALVSVQPVMVSMPRACWSMMVAGISSKARSDTRSVSSCSPMAMSVMALSVKVACRVSGPNLPSPVPV